jgi:transcriptional regulator with XRE-family HTH domain
MLEKAMNQTQLRQAMAENERLHPDTISDIVSGKKNKYTLRSLQLIAKALDVPITELMDDF